MERKRIEGIDYVVEFEPEKVCVNFKGELSLGGPQEYSPIRELLEAVAEEEPENMTIDLRDLHFLNSSGISMLSKFIIGLRKRKKIQLTILGSEQIPWQKKSLKNFQKFLPGLKLEIS